MSMNTVDQTLASSLDLYLDGFDRRSGADQPTSQKSSPEHGPTPEHRLSAAEQDALQRELAHSPELAAEKAQLEKLHLALAESRIRVRDDFTAQVMAALPQARPAAARGVWKLPLAMMLFMALGAAVLIGTSFVDNPLVGTGLALLDFAQTTVLAGSGIIVATWRGAGMGLQEMLGSSVLNVAAFAMLVLCLNLLFVSLWRRRSAATAEASAGELH